MMTSINYIYISVAFTSLSFHVSKCDSNLYFWKNSTHMKNVFIIITLITCIIHDQKL